MKEGRSSFNPCQFCEHVYLCGSGSRLVEVFSPHTDLFLSLPLPHLPEDSSCATYVHNNLLIVHSANYIFKFAPDQYSQLAAKTTVSKWSNSPLVLDAARGFFFIVQEEKCVCFNMETGAEVQSFAYSL